jgi:hypothetical protein
MVLESGKKHPEDILNELRLSTAWIEAFCGLEPGRLKVENTANVDLTMK